MEKSSISSDEWKTIKDMLNCDSLDESIKNAIEYAYLTGFDDGIFNVADD